jgi:hypothetical protein
MYQALLGPSFHQLSQAVRVFHQLRGPHVLHGWVRTEAPVSPVARFLALCLGTPLAPSDGAIRFELDAQPDREVWVRHFPKKTMTSCLRLAGGELTEHLGLARLHFDLDEVEGRLVMRLKRLRFLGVPCPRWAMPVVIAEEEGASDHMRFHVRASLPLIGQVAGYRGYLVIGLGEPE